MQRPGREKDARRKPVTDEKAVQDGVTYKQPIQVSGAEKDITQVLRKGKRFNPKTREIRQPFQKTCKKARTIRLSIGVSSACLPLPAVTKPGLSSFHFKSLYELFNSAFGAAELRFPFMPHEGQQAYVVSEEYHVRMTLSTSSIVVGHAVGAVRDFIHDKNSLSMK